jgi:GT2 family glycosyltransferase
VVDRRILKLWKTANGQELDKIIRDLQDEAFVEPEVRAGLACLAEAGLLLRDEELDQLTEEEPFEGPLVSVVIVSHNSREWLEICLPSLYAQTYRNFEIILVDNGSSDGSAKWVETTYPDVRVVRLETSQSLAKSINTAIQGAGGNYYLVINPDVRLEPDAISQLITIAQKKSDCGAVAAKLKFFWAPSFLNGLGNYVGAFSWGTDNGLGHLDLGQFDQWKEVPSACFAATLITASAWRDVGPLDEHLPLYYEDSEWCYRARLYGYKILAAPGAVFYHAMGSRTPSGVESSISPQKLHQVGFGRLWFITKLLTPAYFFRFLCGYVVEDIFGILIVTIGVRWKKLGSYLRVWGDYLRSYPGILRERNTVQSRRVSSDKDLFNLQRSVPIPLIWHGFPLLTWDTIRYQYHPLIATGKTKSLPEFSNEREIRVSLVSKSRLSLRRMVEIWRTEGSIQMSHYIWRYIQWSLMQP